VKRFAAGKTMNLDDPVATALRVARLLERAEIPYALYGGLAVAAYGVARDQIDVAALASEIERLAGEIQDHDVGERWRRCQGR